jgi:Raf kinase inhibitor-like YbhB/YbcL family protein
VSRIALIGVAGAIALSGCGGDDETVEGPPPEAPDRIELTSTAFEEGGTIPVLYTCDGADVSPPLAWERVPSGTPSLAILVEDPDADGGTFVHWSAYRFAPSRDNRLDEGQAPVRSRQGKNSFGKEFYRGPCPSEGDDPHRYVFAIYALRAQPKLEQGAEPEQVRAEIAKLATARGVLTGTFGR